LGTCCMYVCMYDRPVMCAKCGASVC
jgi:hypothetical protein